MNSKQFIDYYKNQKGLGSYYQVAKALGISQSRLSMYRREKREFDDATALKVEQDLALPRGYVMCEIQAARAKDPDIKKAWIAVAKTVGGKAMIGLKNAKGKAHAVGLASLLFIMANLTVVSDEVRADAASAGSTEVHDLFIMRISRDGSVPVSPHHQITLMLQPRTLIPKEL